MHQCLVGGAINPNDVSVSNVVQLVVASGEPLDIFPYGIVYLFIATFQFLVVAGMLACPTENFP